MNGIPVVSLAGQLPPSQHPLGSRARVLLTSVFGPYAQDDEYGSRVINPMELYHNQVTRVQGPFSLRMFHRSWGLMLIQCNIQAPCMLLDFPTQQRFLEEIQAQAYDVVGISSIPPNIDKVRHMCQWIRDAQPNATIVVGGHIANMPDLRDRIQADHVVRGDGVRWFRHYLGENDDQPIRHPQILSGIGTRCLGVQANEHPGTVAGTLIPSVGCPMGCNFCSTSAMFGGKGKHIDFYETGDELFDVMCQLEEAMQVQSFFVSDENFLLHRPRALRLLELMEQQDKAWSLYVFSSANVLRTYTLDELVRLGIDWVWLGLEGKQSQYIKLRNIDTQALVRQLQSHGIHVLGSTIIGLEEHTPENIDAAIEYAVQHNSDFHQFMLYTPVVGTPLHAELTQRGWMKDDSEFHPGDIHGQLMFSYRHPHILDGQEGEFILRAFQCDFERNGPSLARMTRTSLAGWKRYKNHPRERVRRRFSQLTHGLSTRYAAVIGAARRYYRDQPEMYAELSRIQHELCAEFGLKARLFATVGGAYVHWKLLREEKRLAAGWTYEPPTFYESNFSLPEVPYAGPIPSRCQFVTPRITKSCALAHSAQPSRPSISLVPSGSEQRASRRSSRGSKSVAALRE